MGGFLVSRLVQLSSEREGLRRQLVRARDELSHVTASYNDAHEYRLENSRQTFLDWVTDKVVDADPATLDRAALLEDNIPRGSSTEEMGPYLDALINEVAEVREHVQKYVRPSDDNRLDLDDLRKRGLTAPDGQASLYEKIVGSIAEQLPASRGMFGISPLLNLPIPRDSVSRATELRRLDESIREEQDLLSRKTMLEGEFSRVTGEIERIGQPIGVTSAIVILAVYSVLGIVAPVVVMGFDPTTLESWLEWLLVGVFVFGLAAVLGYIFWYAKTLNDPVASDSTRDASGPGAGQEIWASLRRRAVTVPRARRAHRRRAQLADQADEESVT
ncbi:hypothetical protein ACGFIY_10195 [Micromonospora chersina]|uniref:hypothetical protein n=1 Tax=Micromonospora chersina TaxID=47854 RepID=UPI0037182C88